MLDERRRESIERSDGMHVLASAPLLRLGLRAANVTLGHTYCALNPLDAAMSSALHKVGG